MSEEDKELLARISQVAGQINRHKNQQVGSSYAENQRPSPHRYNQYRHNAAPYPTRGTRGRIQRPRPHQHRTLHLNAKQIS